MELRPDCIPRHVAVIMDGNGRWAERRGLGRIRGHRQGLEALRGVSQLRTLRVFLEGTSA